MGNTEKLLYHSIETLTTRALAAEAERDRLRAALEELREFIRDMDMVLERIPGDDGWLA